MFNLFIYSYLYIPILLSGIELVTFIIHVNTQDVPGLAHGGWPAVLVCPGQRGFLGCGFQC